MSDKLLYSQSHLYPSMMSSIHMGEKNFNNQNPYKGKTKTTPKFIFYSPLDSYLTMYRQKEQNLVDLSGKRYYQISNIKFSNNDQATILKNQQQFLIISEDDDEILTYEADPGQRIISNVLSLDIERESVWSENRNIKLMFLTCNNNIPCDINLNYASFTQLHQPSFFSLESQIGLSEDEVLNFSKGQGILSFETLPSQNEFPFQQFQQNPPTQFSFYNQQSIPLFLSSQQSQNIHTYQLLLHNQQRIIIFDQTGEKIHFYSPDYKSITNIIQTFSSPSSNVKINPHTTHKKLTQLSENLLLQYTSNTTIKLIDPRVSRIVHATNLMQNIQTPFQQHFIKFWNEQIKSTQQIPNQPTTKFTINLANKLVEIDLRYESQRYRNQVFRSDQAKYINNFQIDFKQGQKLIAFTSETQSAFKTFILAQTC